MELSLPSKEEIDTLDEAQLYVLLREIQDMTRQLGRAELNVYGRKRVLDITACPELASIERPRKIVSPVRKKRKAKNRAAVLAQIRRILDENKNNTKP